jgi:hypothetical protein
MNDLPNGCSTDLVSNRQRRLHLSPPDRFTNRDHVCDGQSGIPVRLAARAPRATFGHLIRRVDGRITWE